MGRGLDFEGKSEGVSNHRPDCANSHSVWIWHNNYYDNMDAQSQKRISVVIPAYNEEKTIFEVIAATKNEFIDDVIVVNDGSSDDTENEARRAGATVVTLAHNVGKGAAMDVGVACARHDIICFLDADVLGLTKQKLDAIILPVAEWNYEMFVGICRRKIYWLNKIIRVSPILGGERVIKRKVWESVLPKYKKNFQIEIALNYHVKKSGGRMGFLLLPNLTHLTKEIKHGLAVGILERLLMAADIVWISSRLYIFDSIARIFKDLFFHRQSENIYAVK